MSWPIALIGGIILGLWAFFESIKGKKNNRNNKRNRNDTRDNTPRNFASAGARTSGRYQIKSDDDGYSRVVDKQTGACVFESPNKSEAADWKRSHE